MDVNRDMARTVDLRDQGAALAGAWRNGLLFVLVTIALIAAHRLALLTMVRTWDASPMYSYGFTVPFVSAYLLWTRRAALAALTPRPSWLAGGSFLLGGLGLTIAARAGGIQVLEQVAFLLSLVGIVFVLFGAAYVRTGWAALAYLLLMVPLWDGFTESLHEPFQRRSAAMGMAMLRAVGIPVFREGTFITLPNLQIEVARACSGVNYLVAVLALGLPLAYVFLQDMWRRVVLIGSAILIAALSNGLRVALICVLAHYEVGSALHGPFHVLHGLFVAGIGYVVLFAGLRALAPKDGARREAPAPAAAPAGPPAASVFVSARAAVALIVLFLAVGSNVLAREPQPVALNGALDAFPATLGGWTAMPASRFAARPLEPSLWPGADTEYRRRYRRADGAVVDLYIAYFESQQQTKKVITYHAADLHNRASAIRLTGGDGGQFAVNFVTASASGPAVLFWYDVHDRPEINPYSVKAWTLWNAIWRGRNNGAVVVLTSGAGDDAARAAALQDLGRLVRDALAPRWSAAAAGRSS
jgi:EpsI family protein